MVLLFVKVVPSVTKIKKLWKCQLLAKKCEICVKAKTSDVWGFVWYFLEALGLIRFFLVVWASQLSSQTLAIKICSVLQAHEFLISKNWRFLQFLLFSTRWRHFWELIWYFLDGLGQIWIFSWYFGLLAFQQGIDQPNSSSFGGSRILNKRKTVFFSIFAIFARWRHFLGFF